MTFSMAFRCELGCRKYLLLLVFLHEFSSAQPAFESPHSFLQNLSSIDLIDQHGHAFSPDSLAHHVVLFNFIYTHCATTCSLQTYVLAQVMQALPAHVRSRVQFVSVSIDPANDTPEKLRTFAQQMQADLAGWRFLTGDAQQIEQLARHLQVLDEGEAGSGTSPQLHRTSLWLVDAHGRMLQRYQGDPPDKDRLVRELEQVSRLIAATD